MNILQRRMFQKGGEATPSFTLVDPGRSITREEMTGFGAGIGGGRDPLAATLMSAKKTELMDIVADETGQLYGKEGDRLIPIDMAMGRTPREALLNMEKEMGIESLRNNAMLAATLLPAGRLLGGGTSKVRDFFYKPSSADFTVTPGGVASAVTIGDKITGPGKTALFGLGAGSLYLGAEGLKDAAVTTPDEIAASLEEIESSKPKESSTEVAAKITDDKIVEVKNSEVTTEDPTGVQDETDVLVASEAEEPKTFQTTIFQNPNFVRLIRNLSAGLATSESMAEGLAKGAASAASERFLADQEEIKRLADLKAAEGKSFEEIQEFILKEKIKNIPTKKEQADAKVELANFADAFAEADTSEQLFGAVLEIASKNDISGLGPVSSSLFKEYVRRPLGAKVPLTARERAIKILEQISNGQIKTITGESGRTISNNDRKIARELVGNLRNPLVSEEDVLARISLQLTTVAQRKKKAKNQYDAYAAFFSENGLQIPIQLTTDKINTSFGSPQAGRVRIKLSPTQ